MISTAVPPWPNRITGPEDRVVGDAGEQLDGIVGRATICCTRNPSSRACGMRAPMRASIAAAASRTAPASPESERDPADIGFVDDVRRADFQRDREAERSGRGGGLVGIGGETRLRARNAVGIEHGLDFGRIEPGSAVGERSGDRGPGGAGIGSNGSGRAGGLSISSAWLR